MKISLAELIDKEKLPRHVAIIMDGNGRWAQQHGEQRIFGHQNAIESVRAASEGCGELGIPYLTLYAFSTENWGRPTEEVNALMELMVETIEAEMETVMKNNVKVLTIGDVKALPERCQRQMEHAKKMSQFNTGLKMIIALNYSSRWEITEAVKKIASKVKSGKLDPSDINENTIRKSLETHDFPDPELMIRTSGEQRLS